MVSGFDSIFSGVLSSAQVLDLSRFEFNCCGTCDVFEKDEKGADVPIHIQFVRPLYVFLKMLRQEIDTRVPGLQTLTFSERFVSTLKTVSGPMRIGTTPIEILVGKAYIDQPAIEREMGAGRKFAIQFAPPVAEAEKVDVDVATKTVTVVAPPIKAQAGAKK